MAARYTHCYRGATQPNMKDLKEMEVDLRGAEKYSMDSVTNW